MTTDRSTAAANLLARLRRLEYEVRADGEWVVIRHRAPDRHLVLGFVITDELRREVIEHKPELLRLLREEN